jgi:transcription antitermination protein NusB
MTRRSRAREVALQLLVWRDMNPTASPEAVEQFVRDRLRDPIHEPFARRLYDGVLARQSEIDAAIVAAAENWRLPRMPVVDRNVLRIGVLEMLDKTDPSPAAVVINEAIELARRYGSADSPSFVNGVLDRIKNQEVVSGQESRVGDAGMNAEVQTQSDFPAQSSNATESITSSLITDHRSPITDH